MKVCVGAGGRFHVFDLARQLERLGALQRLYTGYPRFKVDGLSRARVSVHPGRTVLAQAVSYFNVPSLYDRLNLGAIQAFDRWMAQHLDSCGVLHTLSSFGTETQRVARQKYNALLVCDRGSAHIRYQDEILAGEFALWGKEYRPIPAGLVERELQEYEAADVIVVPSTFAYRSFVEKGVAEHKLRRVPLGVDLKLFHPHPKRDDTFRVLFVGMLSLQKGIPYLLQVLDGLHLPKFEMCFIGAIQPEVRSFLAKYEGRFRYLGVVHRGELAEYYSQASVLVLPSVQDGFGMVMPQAMACGVPVIATTNTGAADLYAPGQAGYIVPIRDSEALRERILELYRNLDLQRNMGRVARERVQQLNGWNAYGETMTAIYRSSLEARAPALARAPAAPSLPALDICISVGGKFHAFHLAEQLQKRGWLSALYTTYFNPNSNARGLAISRDRVHVNLLPELLARVPSSLPGVNSAHWIFRKGQAFDAWVASRLQPCDILVGWSGFSSQTLQRAKQQGATGIVVRGSAHIVTQKRLLDEEAERYGAKPGEVDDATVEKELQEYELADYVAMPSRFCERTFLEQGVPKEKLLVWPLGADIRRYSPGERPATDTVFRVLYVGAVSLGKGVIYLLEAFAKLNLPGSELVLVGAVNPQFTRFLRRRPDNVRAVGIVRYPQLQEFYRRCSVFVLPSIQDGFGQVVMQAMACAKPVVVSSNAGASEAVIPGENGYVVPPRDAEAIAEALLRLYDQPDLRQELGGKARRRALAYTWDNYGAVVESSLLHIREERLCGAKL